MRKTINAKPVEWPAEVEAKWEAFIGERLEPGEVVTDCNYFTPRPWRNEYDRGSGKEGFVYTLNGRHVCYGVIAEYPIKREPN